MKIIEKYTNSQRNSFLILILPYLGIISVDYIISPITTFSQSIFIALCILIFNYLYNKILNPIQEKILLNSITNSIVICIFYGAIFIEKTNKVIEKISNKTTINQWFIIFILFFISILFQIWIYKKHKDFLRVIKTFFIIFSIVMIVYKIDQNRDFFKIDTKENLLIKKEPLKKEKPVILIITDGYVSPNEFYNYYKDSSVFNFSKMLFRNSWIVRNNSLSEEITTIHSLSSLFNYNQENKNKKDVSSAFWGQHLIKSKLAKDLKIKNIQIYNFGILDIGDTKRFTKIYYYYPETDIGQFFDKSMLNIKYLNKDSGLVQKQFEHNKYILEEFSNFINYRKKDKSFYYVHLLMPHDPYLYSNQFVTNKKVNPDKYFEFWKFTNYKLDSFLMQLTKENKYRIILTGDHGYGNIGGGIKAKSTFSAFYGFDSISIKNIKTVQDIGILINRSF